MRMFLVLGLLGAAGCSSANPAPERPIIFVSIAPHASVVQAVAGDAFEVRTLLPAQASHVAYEPKPSQLRALGRAACYIRIGLAFENNQWKKIRAANPRMRIVEGWAGTGYAPAHGEEDGAHSHEQGNDDPHIWLTPQNAVILARTAFAALADMHPESRRDMVRNLEGFEREMDALDKRIRGILAERSSDTFWVYHPSWGRFAETYGLTQRAIEFEGKEPGAKTFAALIDEARQTRASTLFVEPGFGSRKAEALAREVNASVETLDPMARDLHTNLLYTAERIAEALQ